MPKQELICVVMPNGVLQLEWADAKSDYTQISRKLQKHIYRHYLDAPNTWLLFLGFCAPHVPVSPSLAFWRQFAGYFARQLRLTPDIEQLREKVRIPADKKLIRQALADLPMMIGAEYVTQTLLNRIWAGMNAAFCQAIVPHAGSVADFIHALSPDTHLVGRVFFHLVENKSNDRPFAFLATYSTGLNADGTARHLPLKHALQEYQQDHQRLLELLSTVYLAARDSRLIAELVESRRIFHPLAWQAGDAFHFLQEIPIYENCGILCRIPNWWRAGAASVRLSIRVGQQEPSVVGMDALLAFEPRLMIGDHPISADEARRLLAASDGLALIKNKWVAVDADKLQKTLQAYENAEKMMRQTGLSLREALRLQLNPAQLLGDAAQDADIDISKGQWLEAVEEKLRDPHLSRQVSPGAGFQADLRPYQQQGINWLCLLHTLQFGACLADDMGLGKTVQVLGFLSVLKSENHGRPSLLIIPASLIANWMAEIERFFPILTTFVAHPDAQPTRRVAAPDPETLAATDLVITTYALARRYDWLQSHEWQYLILDEAQAIKNPASQQTRTIKRMKACNRIIMTGTPIENRLSDLWSLFDFLNPGLLGNQAEFNQFSKSLSEDTQGYSRLRNLVRPYLLRRLKTDRSIISDLPDKIEMKTYAPLERKQVVLYRQLVQDIEDTIANSEGIQRKGLILAAIMKFKQLCNHADQYLGTGAFAETDSGKFGRLREICETIYDKRERVLVFTQFKEMTAPLDQFLSSIFQRPGLVLHGGVAVGKRKKIIEQFQSSAYTPYMVLSLRAGGVGLNLTQANHVIHFDRWWNPAVENQATDRVFRIGQKKNVIVHKFITRGTIEEKIDQMIEKKVALSEQVVAKSGEAWITEMSNHELLDMFKLTL